MAPPSRVRVVFTGHAGLAKRKVLQRLCDFIDAAEPKAKARWYSAEASLRMETFLDADPEQQRKHWRESLRTAIDQWEMEKPDYGFLSIHLSYQRYSRTLLPMTWLLHRPQDSGDPQPERSLFEFVTQKFQPHYFVSLIDDIPFVQARIRSTGKFRIPLRQLYVWRDLEIHLTDFLAQDRALLHPMPPDHYPHGNSYVVATQHPPQMLYRLIAQPSTVRLYASYPITSTRVRPSYREEIDRFRAALHNEFTVFDPLTIDETVIEEFAQDRPPQLELGGTRDFRTLRWPMTDTLSPGLDNPVTIDAAEARDVHLKPEEGVPSIIEDQVETRDLRLIAQSDCIVTYRPQFRGNKPDPRPDFSGGTAKEWDFAGRMERFRFLIHDPVEDGILNTHAFHSKGMTPYKFDKIGNLSVRENQERVLRDVIETIRREAPTITQYRKQVLSP